MSGDMLDGYLVTLEDANFMRTMAKINFNPKRTYTLPGGKKITGKELKKWLDANK